MKKENRLLRLKQIIGDPEAEPPIIPIIPVSRSGWYRGIAEGRFPQGIKLGRAIAWRESDIQALIENLGA